MGVGAAMLENLEGGTQVYIHPIIVRAVVVALKVYWHKPTKGSNDLIEPKIGSHIVWYSLVTLMAI